MAKEYTKKYVEPPCLCPEVAECKSIEGSGDMGRVIRMYFCGGHPASPDGFEGLV